jgi:3-methyladenine DNA glycosylase AlkD
MTGQGLVPDLDSYIAPLLSMLEAKANPKAKAWWEGYVKHSAPFLGVGMPIIRKLVHQWHRELVSGELDAARQVDLALALCHGKHTEEKLAATLFLQEILMPSGALKWEREIERFAALFVTGAISDWNVCDWFCVKVLATLIQLEGEPCARRISEWHQAAVLWQARASLVPFTKVADDARYYSLIEASCATLIRRHERFAKTAVGWILRDISKYDSRFVERVIRDNLAHFSRESLRNATKYFDGDERKRYLKALRNA